MNSLFCRVNPKNQTMWLPTTGDREDNVLAENDRDTCEEVNHVNNLNFFPRKNIPEKIARLKMR